MNNEIEKILTVITNSNDKNGQWSYLTSIEYMLSSKLYVDSLRSDAKKVVSYVHGKDCKILDFGTGSGIFSLLLRGLNKNIGLEAIDAYRDQSQKDPNFSDTSGEQKKIWREFSQLFNVNFSHYNGIDVPYPDNTFDIITAYAVFEHVDPNELEKITKEMRRVLKHDGLIFVFKTPRKLSYAEYFAKLLGFGHHDLLYGDREMKDIFLKQGFTNEATWKSNMVVEFPGRITNALYPILKALDFMLSYSPFRIFAHHNNFIFRNTKK